MLRSFYFVTYVNFSIAFRISWLKILLLAVFAGPSKVIMSETLDLSYCISLSEEGNGIVYSVALPLKVVLEKRYSKTSDLLRVFINLSSSII